MTPFEGERLLEVEGEKVVDCPHCKRTCYHNDARISRAAAGISEKGTVCFECTMCSCRWTERDGIRMWENETGVPPTPGGMGY